MFGHQVLTCMYAAGATALYCNIMRFERVKCGSSAKRQRTSDRRIATISDMLACHPGVSKLMQEVPALCRVRGMASEGHIRSWAQRARAVLAYIKVRCLTSACCPMRVSVPCKDMRQEGS